MKPGLGGLDHPSEFSTVACELAKREISGHFNGDHCDHSF
jgi:hypothetical protein